MTVEFGSTSSETLSVEKTTGISLMIPVKLEPVFIKHYAPNVCLPLTLT